MGLLVDFSKVVYFMEAVITNSLETELPPDFLSILFRYHKTSVTYFVLAHTTIFAVKFSYLFFFHILVRRVRKMMIYWWTVLAILVVAWAVTISVSIFLPCPYFDIRSCTAWSLQFSSFDVQS